MQNQIYIGTSGWSYKHWRGTFYPQEVKVKDQFNYYLENFNTVEINNTFYNLPAQETFLNWKKNTPDDFTYVIKASRYITHMKKLHDPAASIVQFMDRIILLEEKLGAVLFQLPPFMKPDLVLLENFLIALPKKFRYVFEFRNIAWYTPELYLVLKKYNCAFCIYELAGHISPLEITADFVYLRLHGPGDKYQGSYSDEALKNWAKQCKNWLKTKDVFVYFDNDQNGYAPFNALKLKEFLDF
ncbi:DUF72 domain-containing protein [Flavobacterium sp.]|uniref:DUF72 domain-containing protein n=1 Tax=Flavobacterium sp. TaxID=239 RepID=UPI00374D0B78